MGFEGFLFIDLCVVFGNGIAFSENEIFLLCIFNLILFGVSLSPCWYKGKHHELLNGNAQLCRCASPKVQHLKSCWFSKTLYLPVFSP